MKFIESSDEDQWLYQQSIKYADITLDQLGYVTYIIYKNIILYYSAWVDQRLAPVLQIICNPVYKWLLRAVIV